MIRASELSKWYGNILGISDITLQISSGITGLLGPNGAGKSTFMKICTGQLKPSIGSIDILGKPVFSNAALYRHIGYCPEHDAYYREVSGLEQVVFLARTHGLTAEDAGARATEALARIGLLEQKDRKIREYSLGMKQRLKFAASIVHDPEVVFLDEPLRGIDPLWRVRIIEIIKELAADGKTILVASHILPEIEVMTNEIILIHQGKVFAQGNIQYIRDLMDSHPHIITVRSPDYRKLAARLIARNYILGIQFEEDNHLVRFNTNDRDAFFTELMPLICEHDYPIEEILSPDDNLQAVFDYLIGK